MNLTPIANNPLTQQAATSASPLAGVASSGLRNSSDVLSAIGSTGTNPLADLAKLGNAPTQGVAATRNFQQTLASALAEILSKINISAGSSDDSGNDNSSSIIPDFSKTMMPLQLSLAMNSLQNMSTAAKLPSQDNSSPSSQSSTPISSVLGGGTTPGAAV